MTRTTCIGLAGLMMLLGGCVTVGIERPAGYLAIETGPQYRQRFLSVEGNVIASRSVPNPEGGTLDYWSQAVRKELTEVYGYTLKETQPIKAGRLDGALFDFRMPIGGVEQTYLVALFVRDDQIHLVEAGGESEKVAADRDKLLRALRSLR